MVCLNQNHYAGTWLSSVFIKLGCLIAFLYFTFTYICFNLNIYFLVVCSRRHWGEGAKLFTCPYPLKDQARPPRDQ